MNWILAIGSEKALWIVLLIFLVVAFFLVWLAFTFVGFLAILFLDKVNFTSWRFNKNATSAAKKNKEESQTDIQDFDKVKCAECGEQMNCNPLGDCWCKKLPAVEIPDKEAECLCRKCLEEKILYGKSNPVR